MRVPWYILMIKHLFHHSVVYDLHSHSTNSALHGNHFKYWCTHFAIVSTKPASCFMFTIALFGSSVYQAQNDNFRILKTFRHSECRTLLISAYLSLRVRHGLERARLDEFFLCNSVQNNDRRTKNRVHCSFLGRIDCRFVLKFPMLY